MDGQAKRIERAKLKAIGQRNKVDSEEGTRKRKKVELQAQINEDLTALERLREEHDSLNAVDLQQRTLIDKLSNNAWDYHTVLEWNWNQFFYYRTAVQYIKYLLCMLYISWPPTRKF